MSAAITAAYVAIVTMGVHREVRPVRDLGRVLVECGLLMGGVLLILAFVALAVTLACGPCPDTSATAVSATGSQPTSTGRWGVSATGARPCRSGAVTTARRSRPSARSRRCAITRPWMWATTSNQLIFDNKFDESMSKFGEFFAIVASPLFNPALLAMSALKFAIVVLFYMHLKYDHKLFKALFTGPLIVAMGTIVALLFLFLGAVAMSIALAAGIGLGCLALLIVWDRLFGTFEPEVEPGEAIARADAAPPRPNLSMRGRTVEATLREGKALTADLGYTREQVGKIDINEFATYVAVERSVAHEAAARLNSGRIKGRTVRARLLTNEG